VADPQHEIEALKKLVQDLTARVYRLEQAGAQGSQPPHITASPAEISSASQQPSQQTPQPTRQIAATSGGANTPPPSSGAHIHATPTRIESFPPRVATPSYSTSSLKSGNKGTNIEEKIGQYWLNRVGIVAVLIGVSYFLKYAFENNWIGPAGRITIGLLVGIGLVVWSERFRSRGYHTFSYSLKAVGIGTLYLSLWGAFQIYHLIPSSAAFLAMVAVTGATIALAVSQDAELLASFALIGGFATPVLLSIGQNHEVVLFSYVCVLDLATLVMTIIKPWRRLLWGGFLGTVTLYAGWYSAYYSREFRGSTVWFLCLLAMIFAVAPLLVSDKKPTLTTGPSLTLTLLPLLNAASFFLALFVIYDGEPATLTWYAIGLAAVYLVIANAASKRLGAEDTKAVRLLHVAIAVAFLTIAIPLKLNGHWITIGWLVESAVLLWVSVKARTDFLRYLAGSALVLGICRLLFIDHVEAQRVIFNSRFATYAVAIAVLGAIAFYSTRDSSKQMFPTAGISAIGLNLLALIALTWEASDYFNREMLDRAVILGGKYHEITIARSFTYSAIWLLYGVALMAFGFWRKSSFIRWQALILIALTTAKVFLNDISQLGGSYRILSFVVLGVVLLGISYVYQRDWLKLSSQRSGDAARETSP
jgi:uncharacterized membrane protein